MSIRAYGYRSIVQSTYFAVMVLVSLPLEVGAQPEWVLLGNRKDETQRTYIRSDVRQLRNGLFEGWQVIDFREPQAAADLNITYRSQLVQRSFDCTARSVAALSLVFYADNMGKGAKLLSMEREARRIEYANPPKGSPAEYMVNLVCAGELEAAVKRSRETKAFIVEAQQVRAQLSAHFADFAKRFGAIALRSLLNPETLTSTKEIAAGRETISRYKALLAERNKIISDYYVDTESFFVERSPSEPEKRAALASVEREKRVWVKLYGDLDAAQSAVANAYSDILDWGFKENGSLTAGNGKLVFAFPQQQTAFQILVAKLDELEAKQRLAIDVVAAMHSNSEALVRERNEKLQNLLK